MSQYLGDISAYALAVSQGYTGTEEEYAELMASYATVGQTAVTAAQTAATKASEAATSATTATNKATEATTAATTATTKAGEASTSASTATSAKDTAVSAASTATTKATEATTAAATATSAKTDAVAANTAAQSAKTAAQTAQTGAETAAASVAESAAQIQENADDIAQLKSEKADVTDLLKAFPTDTASGAIASFSDGAELPIKSLMVDIEPVQDLHGYDNPWPAGGGKNKLPYATIESQLTRNGITFVRSQDGSIAVNGTATVSFSQMFVEFALQPGSYYFNCGNGFSMQSSAYLYIRDLDNSRTLAEINTSNIGTDRAFSIDVQTNVRFYMVLGAADLVISGTLYPMIRLASVTDATYAPYENICPISGHTQAVVTRTGVNVWDEEWEVGGISADNGENVTATDRIRSKNYISVVPGVSYYFKASNTIGLRLYDGNKHYVTSTVQTNLAYTIPANIRYVRFIVLNTTTYNHDTSINYPATDTDYHEGHVQSITIDLGQTVYGGTLDVTKGELVIDRAGVDLGTLNWRTSSTQMLAQDLSHVAESINTSTLPNATCSIYKATKWGSVASTDNSFCVISNQVLVYDSRFTDATAFKTAVTGQTLMYALATPITVTLTANELSTLLGANNIWSDAGEVTAEYRADPTLYIQRKIAEALS